MKTASPLARAIPLTAAALLLLLLLSPATVHANSLRTSDDNDVSLAPRNLATMEYMAAMSAPYTCVVERGFDYVGNDMANARGAASDCCGKCRGLAGCVAWSWSDYEGGTCWLKSGRGTVFVNPSVTSAIVIYPSASDPAPCGGALDTNTDYVGNDVGRVKALKPEACCAECAKVPNCRAFTHTDFEGGTCWLKSDRGRMIVKPGAASSVTYGVTPQPRCGLEVNVDYVGNDIGSALASKAVDCCARCQAFAGCRAFSWSASTNTCYFKNRKDATIAKSGVTSAAVFPNPRAPSCAMELGTDYVGNDIGSAPSAGPYGCCSICMKAGGCGAFSWTSQNGGTCWLKSAKGATVANANVQSAVV